MKEWIRERPWIWLVLLFVIPMIAWTCLLVAVNRAHIQELPPESLKAMANKQP